MINIGFIGFGEAGSSIACGLQAAGGARLFGYDIKVTAQIEERASAASTTLVSSPSALARQCSVLVSTVTADAALAAATQNAPFLEPDHVYADMNSVSPEVKSEIAGVIAKTGARFVEIAIMAPVLPYGHRVPMLLGGPSATSFAEMMRRFGMRLETVDGNIGTAAAIKMFRSIIVKGLEALVVECVLGAGRYDADRRVFDSLAESFPGIDWPKLADYMVGRVLVHGERRAHEMEEVAKTLRSIGIDPIMAEATARRQAWGGDLGRILDVHENPPAGYRSILKYQTR